MKSTTFAKSRITVLRELLNLSQKEFADNVGITQGALSQLESGKSKLSLDSIQKISLAFKADCNWLVNGKGNIFMKSSTKKKEAVRHSVRTIDLNESTLIPLILEEAHAGYIKGCRDSEYLSTLDVYKIPGYETGNYRLFEINGDSMVPTIYPREIVVSEFIEDWDTLENGSLCIIITEEGIVAKRAYFYEEDRNILILKSDNSQFKTYSVNMDEVIEIWKVQAKITNVFVKDHLMDAKKMESLESDIQMLKDQMAQLSAQGNKQKDANNNRKQAS